MQCCHTPQRNQWKWFGKRQNLATLVRSEMGHVKQREITRKPNTTQRWQNDELEKDSKGNARCLSRHCRTTIILPVAPRSWSRFEEGTFRLHEQCIGYTPIYTTDSLTAQTHTNFATSKRISICCWDHIIWRKTTRPPRPYLTFWQRSFTFNSNKSPTWCNNFSVYYPDVCLQLNVFREFSRPSPGAQWLQWQPLVLPSYRGDSHALFVFGPAGSTCFGSFPAHHQELNDCSGSLWFYLRIVVIVVVCSWSGRSDYEHSTTIATIRR